MSAERPPSETRFTSSTGGRLRICIAYDRLYPWSIGGAERWYRLLAERLASDGHYVTYVTTRQWPAGEEPSVAGVNVVAIAREDALYVRGRRRVIPVLRFGAALWWHLLVRGHRYDAVHTSAMTSLSALASGSLTHLRRYRLVLDWWEVWTWRYWRRYIGAVAGTVGWLMQRLLATLPHQALAYSRLHASRLQKLRQSRTESLVRGGLVPRASIESPKRAVPMVVYAGRFIPEKQIPALVLAVAQARMQLPSLQATLIGEGPDMTTVNARIRSRDLDSCVHLPGFVTQTQLVETLERALCLVLLSRREGYGLVVVEAAAFGVPSIVLRHSDSAAAELIVDGVNGFTCASADPQEVASAILRVYHAGHELRCSTLAWFKTNASDLTIEGSLPRILNAYGGTFPEVKFDA